MANPNDIDRGAVVREAQGAAENLLKDPEVQSAIELLSRRVEAIASPVEAQFPEGETPVHQFRQTLRAQVIKAVREALVPKPGDKG